MFGILLVVFPLVTILFIILSPHFVSDSRMHLLIARNLLNGLGHSYLEASPQDISQIKAVSINFWPPGYSLLLIPFLAIGLNGLLTITLSDIIAVLIVYFVWYRILKIVCETNFKTIVLSVFAFFTFGYTPLGMYYSLGTNVWALVWFSLAIYQMLAIYQNRNIFNWKSIAWFYLFAFLCSLFRYSYYPISFVLSFSVLVIFYKTFNFRKAMTSLLVPFLLFASFFLYQTYHSQSLNYVNAFHENAEPIVHYSNLEKTTAIISNSFLFPINYKSSNWIWSAKLFLTDLHTLNKTQILNTSIKLIFTLSLSVLLVLSLLKFYRSLTSVPKRLFVLFLSLIIGQILFLVILSLKYPPEIFRGVNVITTWTYVEEVRYYNAVNLIIMVAGLWAFLQFRRFLAFGLLSLLFLFNLSIFVKQKQDLSLKPESNIEKKNFWILTSIPETMLLPNAVFYEKELVQRKSNYHFVSVMFAERNIPTLKFIPPQNLKTSKPMNLIFAIDQIEEDGGDAVFKQLILKNQSKKLGTMFNRKVEIWSIKLNPGQPLNL
jgi:hypothetical protein